MRSGLYRDHPVRSEDLLEPIDELPVSSRNPWNHISSVKICGRPGMGEDDIESIKRVVDVLEDEGRGGK